LLSPASFISATNPRHDLSVRQGFERDHKILVKALREGRWEAQRAN
jgi:hypothetical protein